MPIMGVAENDGDIARTHVLICDGSCWYFGLIS
jgi:hypothetical protein